MVVRVFGGDNTAVSAHLSAEEGRSEEGTPAVA